MPLVNAISILAQAKKYKYGVFSLVAGNLEMISGPLRAVEQARSPIIFVFSRTLLPKTPAEMIVPMIVSAGQKASVPLVAAVREVGSGPEEAERMLHWGVSCIMYDGSGLSYEENMKRTREVADRAHACGASVEACIGKVSSSCQGKSEGSSLTDPDMALDFIQKTRVDSLAISFGNAYGSSGKGVELNLDLVRRISSETHVPLVMHGGSGFAKEDYQNMIAAGMTWFCCYSAIAKGACNEIRNMLSATRPDSTLYHEMIYRAEDFFYKETKRLIEIFGCGGKIDDGKEKE